MCPTASQQPTARGLRAPCGSHIIFILYIWLGGDAANSTAACVCVQYGAISTQDCANATHAYYYSYMLRLPTTARANMCVSGITTSRTHTHTHTRTGRRRVTARRRRRRLCCSIFPDICIGTSNGVRHLHILNLIFGNTRWLNPEQHEDILEEKAHQFHQHICFGASCT